MKTATPTTLKLLTTLSLILLLASCQSVVGSKISSDDSSKTIISTYSGGQVSLRDAATELDKLIAKNEKLKGLTFDKLSSDQKDAIIKEVGAVANPPKPTPLIFSKFLNYFVATKAL